MVGDITAFDYEFRPVNAGKWVIGVDAWGRLFVVSHPETYPAEFLITENAEEIGIGYDAKDLDASRAFEPGLYAVNFKIIFDTFSGDYVGLVPLSIDRIETQVPDTV